MKVLGQAEAYAGEFEAAAGMAHAVLVQSTTAAGKHHRRFDTAKARADNARGMLAIISPRKMPTNCNSSRRPRSRAVHVSIAAKQ